MGVRESLRKWFGSPGLSEADLDRIVEAGLVPLAASQLIVDRLDEEEGIPAVAHEDWIVGRTPRARPTARIMVRLGDLDRARPIVDELSKGW